MNGVIEAVDTVIGILVISMMQMIDVQPSILRRAGRHWRHLAAVSRTHREWLICDLRLDPGHDESTDDSRLP